MNDIFVHGVSNWKLYFEGDHTVILDKICKEKVVRTCKQFFIKLNTPIYNIELNEIIRTGHKLNKIERTFRAFRMDDETIQHEVTLYETYDSANLNCIVTKRSKEKSVEKIIITGEFKENK